MTDIGKKLKLLREERNLTMEMLVADINTRYQPVKPFNKSMISRWESEGNEPTLENAKLLSTYFDVSVDYLIGVTDTRTPSRLLHIKKVEDSKPNVIYVGQKKKTPKGKFISMTPDVAVMKGGKVAKAGIVTKHTKSGNPKKEKAPR